MSKTDWCRNCKKRYFNPERGLCCSLTQEPPTFAVTCPDFDIDDESVITDRLGIEVKRRRAAIRRRRAVLCRKRGIHGNFAFVLFLLLASTVFPLALWVPIGIEELTHSDIKAAGQIVSLLTIVTMTIMSVYTFISVLRRKSDAILLLIFYGILYLVSSFALFYNLTPNGYYTSNYIAWVVCFCPYISMFIFLHIVISASASLQVWALFPMRLRRRASWTKWIKILVFSTVPLASLLINVVESLRSV